METYAPFNEVSGYASSSGILGFKSNVVERMGISDAVFMSAAMPVINKIMVAEAVARAPAAAGLYVSYGGAPADSAPRRYCQPAIDGTGKSQPSRHWNFHSHHPASLAPQKRASTANALIKNSIKVDMERARSVMTGSPQAIEAYSPPAVTTGK